MWYTGFSKQRENANVSDGYGALSNGAATL
jgi:hypothetical protein